MNSLNLDSKHNLIFPHAAQGGVSFSSGYVQKFSNPLETEAKSEKKLKSKFNLLTLKNFIFTTGYARWNPQTQASESFEECLDRVIQMHLKQFPLLKEEILWAKTRVQEGLVLPALRSLQYGGTAIEQNHVRMYNTWGTPVDRPEVFGEAFIILLSGGGLGFSVQFHHVAALPVVKPLQKQAIYKVEDSIKGWGEALTKIIEGRYQGVQINLDTQNIRSKGSYDPVSGDYHAGPAVLLQLQNKMHALFEQAQGRKLRPIECYDLFCYIAEAVVADHNGRSAMLALFSPEDSEMLEAKTGNWYQTHPWRQRSNNSVVLLRGQVNRQSYDQIFKYCREWGEPGIYWTNDLNACSNSCVEAGFYPILTLNQQQAKVLGRRAGDQVSGWQGCTLSEINGAVLKTQEDFLTAARAAAIFNTLQASYTKIEEYLGWTSRWLCERDALIGVGITGMMDNPSITLNPQYQKKAAFEVAETNRKISARLGIRTAQRSTLIKPSGKSSLLFGGVASGIHPRHADKYFMRFSPKNRHPSYHEFKKNFPQLVMGIGAQERITFAVQAPPCALVRDELSAIEFLNIAKSTLHNWVEPTCTNKNSVVRHNVSMTVSVHEHEWEIVRDFLWEHQEIFNGVALMGYFGDIKHPLSPFQKLMDQEDQFSWQELFDNVDKVS